MSGRNQEEQSQKLSPVSEEQLGYRAAFAHGCQRNTAALLHSHWHHVSASRLLQPSTAEPHWPDNLLSVFLPNCSSAKLFFYFLLPSLHLQPQSSLPTLPQHGNLYSGWQMSLPVSLLRPYYFLSAATYCYYIRIVIFSPHLFWI